MSATTLSVELNGTATMPGGRLLGAYFAEAKYECIRALRTPAFAIPFLLLPIALYVLFGILLAGSMSHGDPTFRKIMFVNWSVFGVMGPGMFGFGMIVAQERDHGLLSLKRALPMPPAAYFLAKLFMTMTFAAIIMVTLIVPALTLGHVRLGLGQILAVSLLDILGSLPFCAVGFFIGTRASSKSAAAFINLAYLPMMHLGGLFYPLPKSIQPVEFLSPAFYLDKLGLWVAGVPNLDQLPSGAAGPSSHGSPLLCAGALVGVTLLFGVLAIRRLAGTASQKLAGNAERSMPLASQA
ncbi:MAG: ABC transporter permease [Terriglobales bacterium]|jgi:ABC-2 type transport system permease protein